MAFSDLFTAWREDSILDQTLDEFIQMLEDCHWMYQTAATALWKGSSTVQDDKQAIRTRDIRVNQAERSIRKKIVQHLAIRPGVSTNYCLVLMSVVKDAERLGDYAKNLVEVSEYHTTHADDNEFVAYFKDIQADVETMFRKVGRAFRESDAAVGQELLKKEVATTRDCDALIRRILEAEGLTTAQAVCYALLARYYKRFAAHLGNIASSLVMPIHKLDYADEEHFSDSSSGDG